MASRQQRNVAQRFGPDIKVIGGRFFPNGTSDAALTVNTDGGVASVARQGAAGVFLITFSDPYYSLVGVRLQVQHTTAADLVAQLGDVSNLASASGAAVTAVVRVLAGATGTDVTANANSSVFFEFTFNDSSVNRNL